MSDDLEIRYGGAISVDTEVLRDVGRKVASVAHSLSDAWGKASTAHTLLSFSSACRDWPSLPTLGVAVMHVEGLREDLESTAAAVLLMADAYEVVELRAQATALATEDSAAAAELLRRADRIAASDERIETIVDGLVEEWDSGRFEGLDDQFDGNGAWEHLFFTGVVLGRLSGRGVVRPGAPFTGVADPVSVREVATSRPSGPPGSLPEALSRFAKSEGAQVRVERYAMPDGTSRFVTYVKGTQSALYGGAEPWDMKSNAEMYMGQRSASHQATVNALQAAGAKPGDRVDIVAHSQAGMIAAELAMNSPFEVGAQITAGSPVEPTLDDDQLLVQLRHSDDIVSSLAQGGSPGGTGSPDSFTATDVGDPAPGIQDLWLKTHTLESYIETAEEVEASGDPRLDALADLWDELGTAEEIVATEYHAERIDPLPADCPPETPSVKNAPDAGGAPSAPTRGDDSAAPRA
ncbi:hypothetical protein [Microbacterium sp. 179-I 3D4 NHS]|uniref:hypothetical protein n=1 Tax=Microbacterium sp. 179-I 3D4 NHS TaxID=3142381 RepID=UPI0039A0B916